jgi:alpha-L-fucosidase
MVLLEEVEAERLLGPLMSDAGLFTPMAPVVGRCGGTAFTLAPARGGLILAMDLRLLLSLWPWLTSDGSEASGVASKVRVSSLTRSSRVNDKSPSKL